MAAGERFNRSAALVMRAILKSTEAKQKSVSDRKSGRIRPMHLVVQGTLMME